MDTDIRGPAGLLAVLHHPPVLPRAEPGNLQRKWTAVCFALGVLCGVGFAIVKVLEYGEKIRAGITFNTNDFFMYYYVFTGIHFLHVLIGMGVLIGLGLYSRSGGFTAGKIRNLETGASFWHLVDLLWIVLFALLYLIN
jgi:nitric oxide reductase NorE protein